MFSLSINGTSTIIDAPFYETGGLLHRIAFRMGKYRGIGGANPVTQGTDHPIAATSCRIFNLAVTVIRAT